MTWSSDPFRPRHRGRSSNWSRPKRRSISKHTLMNISCAAGLMFVAVLFGDKLPAVGGQPVGLTSEASASSSSPSIYYSRCAEARAAGAAPLRVGEPGYRSELDADGDGVACEPYRGF